MSESVELPVVGGDADTWGGKVNAAISAALSRANEAVSVATVAADAAARALITREGRAVAAAQAAAEAAQAAAEAARDEAVTTLADKVDVADLTDPETAAGAALNATYGTAEMVQGAAGDGTTDDSAAWAAAINAVGDAGGGVVTAPRNRTYIVQGLPLRENVWVDLRGIILKHPTTPTAPMWVAPTAAVFKNGGILGGEMVGYNRTQNCIDFSAVTTLEHFIVEGTYVHDFDRGYNSSGNDRFPILRDSRFWYNNIGAFVTMNHPIIHFCDFRYNDVGLTGDLNDVYVLGCKFNFNRIGAEPYAGISGAGIRNTRFVGCAFARNEDKGLVITHGCSVTSTQFYGNDSADDGLTITHGDNTIVANQFGYMTQQGSYGGACIRFDSTVTLDSNIISDNVFQLLAPTGVGIAAADGSTTIKNALIRGNAFSISHATKAIDLANVTFSNSKVTGNSFLASSSSTHVAGDGFVVVGDLGAGGCDFADNTFVSDRPSNPAVGIKAGSLSGCQFTGNRFRGFAGVPISATFWDGATWNANNGFRTKADGLASVPAASTSVTVTHGLDHPSAGNARFITVTPTNNMGNATKFWVTNVTATTFDIAVTPAPSAYAANFAWSIEVAD